MVYLSEGQKWSLISVGIWLRQSSLGIWQLGGGSNPQTTPSGVIVAVINFEVLG